MNDFFTIIGLYYKTLLFYSLVIILITFSAAYAYNGGSDNQVIGKITRKQFFIISFIISFIVLAFADCGRDYDSYKIIFEESINGVYNINNRNEVVYFYFNRIIRLFTDDFRVFHIVWAFFFLFPVYKTIWDFKHLVHPGFSVFVFSSLFMFQSLNIMRMYLAGAILFWGIRFFINNKPWWFGLLLLISFFIHRSTISLALPWLFLIFFRKGKKYKNCYLIKTMLIVAILVLFYVFRKLIFNGSFLGYRYAYNSEDSGAGFGFLLFYLPFLLIFLFTYSTQNRKNDYILNILFTFFIASFPFYFLSYYIEMIGRVHKLFMSIYMFFPYYTITGGSLRRTDNTVQRNNERILIAVSIAAICLMTIISITSIVPDGIQYYTNIFGFTTR